MLTLTANRGIFTFVGYSVTLNVGWGGDGVFEWDVPQVSASLLAIAQVDAKVDAPKSAFTWE